MRLPKLEGLDGLPAAIAGEIPAVALLTSTLGDDSRLVDAVAVLGYAGLVIAAFGGGHVPGHVVAALARAARRIPVVLASRALGGEMLQRTYGFPGSERDLLSRGLIPAGFLSGLKARVFLSLLLAAGADTDRVRVAFDRMNASVSAVPSPPVAHWRRLLQGHGGWWVLRIWRILGSRLESEEARRDYRHRGAADPELVQPGRDGGRGRPDAA
jgi:glutaminase/asparaginase family protein